jgi:serine/threonine-protein kinase
MKLCTVCKTKYDDGISFCPVDGEVLEDDPSSIVNTVLDGQYQIESMLGKGGMGAVFLARHILLGDRVAIKILPPEMRNNAEWLRRFRREGQAARRFRHPNAVTVYDLRTAADGMIYMVMEYVEGRTLDAELKARGHFTPNEAFHVLEPIMSVLNAAHAMGVVHRDLKPENIMLGKVKTDSEPSVKLLDLGIAKLSDVAGVESGKNTALTMAGQMLGTPYYMSPEQWGELPRDGNSEIDGRADLYSLALVFYEMIAGRKPYSALTLLELRKEHVSITPRRLDEVVPGVSREFSEVIARAMAKDRGDRPATAGALAGELRAVLASSETGSFSPDAVRSSHPAASTVVIERPSGTLSDVNAETILTIDSPPAERREPPLAPPVAESTDMASSMTSPQTSRAGETLAESSAVSTQQQVAPPVVPPPRRGPMALVIGGALVVVLLVVAVGGILFWNSMRVTPPVTNGPTGPTATPGQSQGNGSLVEVARYWVEIVAVRGKSTPARVVPSIPIKSSQFFKFHFIPSEDGYLYIVGPGRENNPTAFLTARPGAESTGLSNNEVRKGMDFSFPTGLGPDGQPNWLRLDDKAGTETYTFIFSATPLTSPQFLGGEATMYELKDTDKTEWSAFLAKYNVNLPTTVINTADSAAPFVAIKLPASSKSSNPLVFDFRIEHK